MVENFISSNPVSLHFGQNIVSSLSKVLKLYGKKVLMVYRQASIKKYGYYDQIIDQLSDFEIFEYSGIKPNPVIEDVNRAIKLGNNLWDVNTVEDTIFKLENYFGQFLALFN